MNKELEEFKKQAARREVELQNRLIKMAETTQRVIEAFQADRDKAAIEADHILDLGKRAGMINESEIPAVRKMLLTHSGATNIAKQAFDEILLASEQSKKAAAAEPKPTGFAVGKKASADYAISHSGGSDDVLGAAAARYR